MTSKRPRGEDEIMDDEDDDNNTTNKASPFVCLPIYGEHKRAVSSVQLAPSRLTKHHAALCASASADGSVKIWDLSFAANASTEPTTATSATIHASATAATAMTTTTTTTSAGAASSATASIAGSPGGGVGGTSSDEVSMNSVSTLVGHSRGINEVCWSKGGDPFVATASDDKTIRLWDAQTGDAMVEFRGHDNFVFCCQFNTPSNLLVSGSFDETVKLWDVRSGECVSTLPAHSDPVTAVAFNRDGSCVVSASHDGLIRIWDVCTGECLKTIFAAGNPPVSHVTYSPNGKYVLAGTLDSTLRLWPMTLSGKAKCSKTYTSEFHQNSKYCVVSRFLVSQPKRRQCIVTGSETGHVILYDIQSRRVHQLLEQVHKDVVLAVDAHDSMELLASGGMSKDRTVRFWAPKEEANNLKRLRKE